MMGAVSENMSRKKWFASMFGIIVLVSFMMSPRPILNTERNELDAASYIAHAFTIALDFDLDYKNEPYDRRGYFNQKTQLPSHPIGPGVLAAPFVAIFSIVDRITGHPVITNHNDYIYSWSRFGFYFSGVMYFLVGLYLYRKVGEIISPAFRSAWVVLIGYGSGVGYYAFQDGYLGHQFEFFTLALTVWASTMAWINYHKRKKAWMYMIVSAIGVALTHLVRPADINVVLLPTLIFITFWIFKLSSGIDLKAVSIIMRRHIVSMVVTLGVLGCVYYILYGTPLPLPIDMYGSQKGSVAEVSAIKSGGVDSALSLIDILIGRVGYIFDICFSSEFGLLFTSPVMVFGIAFALIAMTSKIKMYPVASVILISLIMMYVAIPIAVVLYWKTTASAYGWRYLLSIVAIGYFYVFLVYEYWRKNASGIRSNIAIYALLVLSVAGVFSQIFWGTSEKLHFHEGKNIFGVQHGKKDCCSGYGYLTNLAEEIKSPSAWIAMAAHRIPGFAATIILQSVDADLKEIGEQLGIPDDKLRAGILRYSDLHESEELQLILIYMLTIMLTWFIAFYGKFKDREEEKFSLGESHEITNEQYCISDEKDSKKRNFE